MTQLFINGQRADIDRNTVITFNYSAQDTDNPTAVKSTYSKTVELLGTENNNRIFNNIFDLRQHSLTFHSNKRTPFVLYSGGKQQRGYLKLDSVQKNTDGVVYRCTLVGELSDFFYNLAYDDKGEKRTFASLRYYFTDETGKVMGDREDTHPIFTWDKDYITGSWRELYAYSPDSPTVNPRHVITAAPTYHGYGEDTDCKKMLVWYDALTPEQKEMIPLPSDYKIYEKTGGWFVMENSREMDEFEARDLKSYSQCPAVKCSFLLDAISREENNGGYNVIWDDEIKNSPYYQDTWVIMPKIDFGENDGEADYPFTGIEVKTPYDGYFEAAYPVPTEAKVDMSTLEDVNLSLTFNLQLLLDKPYENLYTSYKRWDKTYYEGGVMNTVVNQKYDYVYGGFAIRLKITSSSGTAYSRTHFLTTETGDGADEGFNWGSNVTDIYGRLAREIGCEEKDITVEPINFVTNGAYATLNEGVDITMPVPGGDDIKVEMLVKYVQINDSNLWLPMATKEKYGKYRQVAYQCTPMLVDDNTNGIYGSVPPKLQRTTVRKKTLFASLCSPFDFLLSFIKLMGLKVIPEGKRIHILPRNRYYTGEVMRLDGVVDLAKGIEIEPVLTQYKWHKYGVETPDSYAGSLYKKKTDNPYGRLMVDTGYQFNNDTKEIMQGVVFENAIPYRLNSIYFNNKLTPAPMLSPTFNVEFFDSGTDVKTVGGLSLSEQIYRVYDTMPKLCLFDKDYRQSDFKNVLVFFTGMDNAREYYVSDALQECEDYAGGQCYIYHPDGLLPNGQRVTAKADTGIPCFAKYKANEAGNYTFSLDFKKPEYTFLGDDSKYSESSTIYERFFKRYVEDMYNPENRKVTLSCFLHGEPNELLRRFYYFDGAYWVMEKLSDYCYTSDTPQKVTLVRINNTANYTDNELVFMKDVVWEDKTRGRQKAPQMNGWVDMPVQYTITFYVDDDIIHTDEYLEGQRISTPAAPVKDNATFNAWIYEDNGKWLNIPAVMPAHDIVCYAHYIYDEPDNPDNPDNPDIPDNPVEPDEPSDYSSQYLTFELLEDSSVKFNKSYMAEGDDMQYSTDSGATWVTVQDNVSTQTFQAGTKLIWKSTIIPSYKTGYLGMGYFNTTGKFKAYGNTMSLLYGDDFKGKTVLEQPTATFSRLFDGCTTLTDARNLVLPATSVGYRCYSDMFKDCTSLVSAPEVLPATTLGDSCYFNMFFGCTSLTEPPRLPATVLHVDCYNSMFEGCTSLTRTPVLPATTLAERCYAYMFYDCASLTEITMLATDISANKCLGYWVSSVSSTGTFVKHPDMESLPIGVDGIPNGWTVEDYQYE